jgi:hypothetical protein
MADIKIVMDVETAPVDRAVRLMDNLESEVRDVERAMKSGLISEKKYNSEMERLNKNMRSLRGAAKGSASDFRKFEKSVYGSGKAMRQKEVAMQQAGYQLQDFIVQIQAGTNPLIAFSQQGSQLAGFFAGPWGAAIGLGIAALGGLGTALLGASWKSKSFAEQMEELSDGLSDYESISNRIANEGSLSKEFGVLAGNAKSILEAIREINNISLKEKIGEFGGLGAITKQTISVRDPSDTSGFLGKFGLNFKESEIFGPKQIKKASDFLELEDSGLNFGEMAAEAQKYLSLVMAIQDAEDLEGRVGPAKELSEFLREQVKTRDFDVEKRKEIANLQQVLFDITKAQAGIDQAEVERVNKARQKAFDAEARRIDQRFKSEADVFGMQVRVSNENEQRSKAIAERERRRIDNKYQAEAELFGQEVAINKETQALIDKRIASEERAIDQRFKGEADLFDQAVAMSDATLAKIEEDAKKAAQAYSNAFEATSFLFKQRFQGEAEVMGQSLTPEGKIGMSYEELLAAGVPHDTIVAMGVKAPRAKKEKKSDLEKLRAQLDLEDALLGKTEARQRVMQTLGVTFVKDNPNIVAGLEEQINKNLELARVEQERIDLANTIGSAMENSLMSMVDGTKSVKDAFRDMAADIVRHLYKVLVVQQMINAFGGMMSGSSNPVMKTIGGELESYGSADGGGYTGNGPRSGGLDGKGGFMMMMHPRETVIDHTKANSSGAGQNVVINQSFNFQANGDDSVKKIIAQAAPQIANMTKKSLLDDRRRGGTTKAVFG